MANDYSLEVMSKIHSQHYFNRKEDQERKDNITRLQMINMLRRTQKMFEWKPVRDEDKRFFKRITSRNLELFIQTNGYTGVIYYEDYFYITLNAGLGGVPNWEYMPMDFIVANPYLKLSKTYHIYDTDEYKKDVVVIPNDSLYQGLLPLISFHSELLTEVQLTKLCILKNNRSPNIATAPDSNAKKDIDGYFADLDLGKISSVFDKNILKNIGSIPLNDGSSRNVMTQALEMEQYQKAALFNDLGMQMNYNMKRETITSSEAQLGEGALLPLPDDMYEMRQIAIKELKEVFDIQLTCEFSSAWSNLRRSINVEIELEEKDSSGLGGNLSADDGFNNSNDKGESTDTAGSYNADEQGLERERVETAEQALNEIENIINEVQSTEQGEEDASTE